MLVRSNLRNPGYHGSLLKETAPCTSLLKDWPCAGTDTYSVLSKSSGPRLGSGLQSTLAGKDQLVQWSCLSWESGLRHPRKYEGEQWGLKKEGCHMVERTSHEWFQPTEVVRKQKRRISGCYLQAKKQRRKKKNADCSKEKQRCHERKRHREKLGLKLPWFLQCFTSPLTRYTFMNNFPFYSR